MIINKNHLKIAITYVFITFFIYGCYRLYGYLSQQYYNSGYTNGQNSVMGELIKQAKSGKIRIMDANGQEMTFVLVPPRKAGK